MSATKHCETCRFWGKSGESAEEFRTCTAVVHDDRGLVDAWRNWDPNEEPHDEDDAAERAEILEFRAAHRAVAVDGSGYRAALRARKDFGCVLHETRERLA